jgi:hypothetical protein
MLLKRAIELSFIFLVLVLQTNANAEVTIPKLFADYMVLQRDQPIHVWGWANAKVLADKIVIWHPQYPAARKVRYA